jgi:hypothetical protein
MPDEPPGRPATPGGTAGLERWRPIPGHKGYEASSLGRVRSVPRTLRDGRAAGGVVLAQQEDRDGYLTVKIRGKRCRVNILVQRAFAGEPQVRHLDGDRENNRPENLAWGSGVENERDKRGKREREELERYMCHPPVPLVTPPVTRGSHGP